MRAFDNGSGFTVQYSENDADNFSASWPCSSVEGKGYFSFAENGDLVDTGGSASENDGPEWVAFSEDCQKYGEAAIVRQRKRKGIRQERVKRAVNTILGKNNT